MTDMTRWTALSKARRTAEAAERDFQTFLRRNGSPRGIAGERYTLDMHAEYRRLMLDAEATHGAYAELLHGTQ